MRSCAERIQQILEQDDDEYDDGCTNKFQNVCEDAKIWIREANTVKIEETKLIYVKASEELN
jgi:hypothetical protein